MFLGQKVSFNLIMQGPMGRGALAPVFLALPHWNPLAAEERKYCNQIMIITLIYYYLFYVSYNTILFPLIQPI